MKKRSRLTKRGIRPSVQLTSDPKSEDYLSASSKQTARKNHSSSETSLLLYKQLNRVCDVLKYELDTHIEGPEKLTSSKNKLRFLENMSRTSTDIVMDSQEMIDSRIEEVNTRIEEVLRDIEAKTREKEEKELGLQENISEEEKANIEQTVDGLKVTIENYKLELDSLSEELKNLRAAKDQLLILPPKPLPLPPQDQESTSKIKVKIQAELDRLQEIIDKSDIYEEQAAAEIPLLKELLASTSDKKLRDWDRQYQQRIAVLPDGSLKADPSGTKTGGGGVRPLAGGGASPPVPPPTPDGGGRKPPPAPSDFPLYDSAVLIELREADERANKASKAIEAVRDQLAAYAAKEEMTPDDIKMMEEKQRELMDKMGEFEEVTKRVQQLVGLVDVASSQLGPPKKPMVPLVEGVRTAGHEAKPEDTLPKVIVCGTGDVDQVPKIIVCEPRKVNNGNTPLYHQLEGKHKSMADTGGVTNDRQTFPTSSTSTDRVMPWPNPDMAGMYNPFMGSMAGPAFGAMNMLPAGMIPGMMPSFPTGPMMGPPPGIAGVGSIPTNVCPSIPPNVCPCRTNKKKKPKGDIEERLEASLNMSEMLAEQNTKLEGSRYELQEAVLNKDKQHDAMMIELQNLKLELQTYKNENKELKCLATQGCGKGLEEPKHSLQGLQEGCKKSGGLCKKELQTLPICKAQAYKEMGLPLPRNEIKPLCPGAKFAVSMGWNENQGCRNELQKSVNCSDKNAANPCNPCPGQMGCVCASRGQQACPVHKGCSPQTPKHQILGSGDRVQNLCPCGCMAPAGQCKRTAMDSIVQTMEQEVKSLQNELELVQAERRGLALQKKLLNCMAEANGAPGPTGYTTGGGGPSNNCTNRAMESGHQTPSNKPLVLLKKAMPDCLSTVELQLNSLREQYRKLQEDFNAKVEEVSMVRVEYEAAKRDALSLQDKCREAEARVDDLLERLRVIELEKTKMAGSKDQMVELDQQLAMAKQRYREGQEELEEIKTSMQDQMIQLEEYRNKYLSAQQTVEEQRRQIDIMELENNRISEQVNLEIQRVKNQFQEKLTELTPLPDMLKATQMKLQECDQLRQLAERNVEQLLNQSDELKDQNKKLESELEELRKHTATQAGEKESLSRGLTTGEKKIEEIKSENNKLRATVKRLEEVALNNDRRLDEKNHEVLQLQTQLETLREESARQVSRTKDRCEAVRRTLQGQISQLECQLAQSRAAARTAQKDRDEIRQRMQAQITSLNDNFEQAQLRIRSLQSHVNYLKSSYTNIFAPEQCTPLGPKPIDGLGSC